MTIIIILLILSLLATAYSQWRILQLQNKYGQFLKGADASNIESTIKKYASGIEDAHNKIEELASFSARMHTQSQFAISKQALIRFNPFGDTGGDQSFVLALLDNHNNGFIISSVHARTSTRIYAKEIRNGLSKYNLSDEETVALQKALNSKKQQENLPNEA